MTSLSERQRLPDSRSPLSYGRGGDLGGATGEPDPELAVLPFRVPLRGGPVGPTGEVLEGRRSSESFVPFLRSVRGANKPLILVLTRIVYSAYVLCGLRFRAMAVRPVRPCIRPCRVFR